ncbi:uncharacterized protein DNG_10255 [Cephalotrichum gorgonifer]|uniref:Uncharacterized protein n=1 Tax=Cephalotrichum gorgonifer TaxID=2041049 RepID=A0AAE8T042_9PEZI|nr:uncharacterized protein DNG_10255 [Cephalotrichum gorgonifer]
MATVTEIIDAFPENDSVFEILRREELLLQVPPPSAMKLWRDHALLTAVHFRQNYIPAKFAPPRDIFTGDFLRLEWQQMNNRQPFYHRNADVDEISYQVSGERTLMTELGTVELRPGDFSRIPVGVAHDNYGREEIHLLIYLHATATECGMVVGKSEPKETQFEGWAATTVLEMMTECLGAGGCDISVSMADETLLLQSANTTADRLVVQRPSPASPGIEWLFKSTYVWIGHVQLKDAIGNVYQRHRRADAIHCQISGTRILVTQRGTLELEAGDFVCIPKGTAYTSISAGVSSHIVVLTSKEVSAQGETTKEAKPNSMEFISSARIRILG